jgi:ubiquinone/menaquinone biosynthesis C-methylase UbiE
MHSILTDKEWATRHVYDEDWIESYWKSRDHPHRTFLADKIGKFFPIRSVLEIGCASGPNLYNIARKFPDADLRGIDINPMAVQKGNEWFRQESISNVKLEVGRAQELAQFADKSFDVVFTDAVLIYISPDEIEQLVKEILRIGRAVVLCEWQLFSVWLALLLNAYYCLRLKSEAFKFKSASHGFFVGHWVRDYRILFKKFVPKENIRIHKLPKEMWDDKGWQTWGVIIEVVNK